MLLARKQARLLFRIRIMNVNKPCIECVIGLLELSLSSAPTINLESVVPFHEDAGGALISPQSMDQSSTLAEVDPASPTTKSQTMMSDPHQSREMPTRVAVEAPRLPSGPPIRLHRTSQAYRRSGLPSSTGLVNIPVPAEFLEEIRARRLARPQLLEHGKVRVR